MMDNGANRRLLSSAHGRYAAHGGTRADERERQTGRRASSLTCCHRLPLRKRPIEPPSPSNPTHAPLKRRAALIHCADASGQSWDMDAPAPGGHGADVPEGGLVPYAGQAVPSHSPNSLGITREMDFPEQGDNRADNYDGVSKCRQLSVHGDIAGPDATRHEDASEPCRHMDPPGQGRPSVNDVGGKRGCRRTPVRGSSTGHGVPCEDEQGMGSCRTQPSPPLRHRLYRSDMVSERHAMQMIFSSPPRAATLGRTSLTLEDANSLIAPLFSPISIPCFPSPSKCQTTSSDVNLLLDGNSSR